MGIVNHSGAGPDAGRTPNGARTSTGFTAPLPPPPPIPDHELLHLIGRGSYGQVWLARNRLGTLRAVKIVSREAFEDRKPFEGEFKGIQRFEPISRSHDGLVDVLQVGGAEDYFYYVMELADTARSAEGNQWAVISSQCSVIGDQSQEPPIRDKAAASLNTDHRSPITDH